MHQQFNVGYIFNQTPKLLKLAINGYASESDMLVKVARERRNDPSITHDKQIFRKFRSNELDDELVNELFDFLGFDEILFNFRKVPKEERKTLGAWFIVKSIFKGLEANDFADNEKNRAFLNFIYAHCQLEKALISKLLEVQDANSISQYLKTWLLVDSFSLPTPTKKETTTYIAKMGMYLCALIEIGFETKLETTSCSFLNKVLPAIEIKNNKQVLKKSSSVLLEKTKEAWAKEKYDTSRLSWSKFYRDILMAQSNDESLRQTHKKYSEIDTVAPDIQAIKKRFERWHKGELFSFNDFRADLAILRTPYKDTERDIGLAPYFLINIFTHIQTELLKESILIEEIVNLFNEYEFYKALAQKRFALYQKTGQLNP